LFDAIFAAMEIY